MKSNLPLRLTPTATLLVLALISSWACASGEMTPKRPGDHLW